MGQAREQIGIGSEPSLGVRWYRHPARRQQLTRLSAGSRPYHVTLDCLSSTPSLTNGLETTNFRVKHEMAFGARSGN